MSNGSGEEVPGEGLVGMTRGFMYAGSSRVVAGLWDADDLVMTELGGEFTKRTDPDVEAEPMERPLLLGWLPDTRRMEIATGGFATPNGHDFPAHRSSSSKAAQETSTHRGL